MCSRIPAGMNPITGAAMTPDTCTECFDDRYSHTPACSKYNRKKGHNVRCNGCKWWNGHHEPSCRTKGYLTASAPAAPVVVRGDISVNALPEMCCGGTCVRAVCEYHK
jgi:hypothetical protein